MSERQVKEKSSPEEYTVEVRFKCSNDDQGRKGAVSVRMKGVGDKGVETGELLQELCQIHERWLDIPLMAYKSYWGWQE